MRSKGRQIHTFLEKLLRIFIAHAGDVIAIELQEGDEVPALECNSKALCGLKDGSRIQSFFSKFLHLEGMLKGKLVTVLFDTEASPNFIYPPMAASMQISIDTN
jgi:hypothetical protein